MRSTTLRTASCAAFAFLTTAVFAAPTADVAPILYPHDVQGPGFQSAKVGQTVANVRGILTAKDANGNGCYIQTPPANFDTDARTSEGLYLFRSTACGAAFAVGDQVQIGSAKVAEYQTGGRNNLHLTELTSTANVTLVQAAAGTAPVAVIVGGVRRGSRTPPLRYIGTRDPFALPPNQTTLEGDVRASSLDVTTYGADFWESLESMLVTLPSPTVLGPLTSFGEVFIVPAGVPTPSRNSRGGLTLAADEFARDANQRWDSNPQAINLIKPFDNSSADATLRLGDVLEDVTGIVTYNFGLYTLTPLTAPRIKSRKPGGALPAPFTSTGRCNNLLVGTYNVENLPPTDTERITKLGGQIDSHLKNPDVVVLNEIQDDDGETDDAVVTANKTLDAVVGAIKGAKYAYTNIVPVNDQDGGVPGGNIRQALIWRPDRLQLTPGSPPGTSTQSVDVVAQAGKARLTLNPGRIDPTSTAWRSSRKPIVGQFDLKDGSGASVFVIGLHLISKGGSTTPYQNPQPPINGGEDERNEQAKEVRDFVQKILSIQPNAKVVVTGDLNEFSYVEPLQTLVGGSPAVLNEVIVPVRTERYSYIFQQNCQELDHLLVSPTVARAGATLFVPHVNTWTYASDQVSDHDPLVARLNVC